MEAVNETGEFKTSNNMDHYTSTKAIIPFDAKNIKVLLLWDDYIYGEGEESGLTQVIKEWDYKNIKAGEEIKIDWKDNNNAFMIPDSFFMGRNIYPLPEKPNRYADEEQDAMYLCDSLRWNPLDEDGEFLVDEDGDYLPSFMEKYWMENGINNELEYYEEYYHNSQLLQDPFNRNEIWGTYYHNNEKRLLGGGYFLTICIVDDNGNITKKVGDYFELKDSSGRDYMYNSEDIFSSCLIEFRKPYDGNFRREAYADSLVQEIINQGVLDPNNPYPKTEKEYDEKYNIFDEFRDQEYEKYHKKSLREGSYFYKNKNDKIIYGFYQDQDNVSNEWLSILDYIIPNALEVKNNGLFKKFELNTFTQQFGSDRIIPMVHLTKSDGKQDLINAIVEPPHSDYLINNIFFV